MRYWFMLLIFISSLFIVSPADAHRPEDGEGEGITVIPDPDTSFAYYRELAPSGEVHVYRIQMGAGPYFHAGINIP